MPTNTLRPPDTRTMRKAPRTGACRYSGSRPQRLAMYQACWIWGLGVMGSELGVEECRWTVQGLRIGGCSRVPVRWRERGRATSCGKNVCFRALFDSQRLTGNAAVQRPVGSQDTSVTASWATFSRQVPQVRFLRAPPMIKALPLLLVLLVLLLLPPTARVTRISHLLGAQEQVLEN